MGNVDKTAIGKEIDKFLQEKHVVSDANTTGYNAIVSYWIYQVAIHFAKWQREQDEEEIEKAYEGYNGGLDKAYEGYNKGYKDGYEKGFNDGIRAEKIGFGKTEEDVVMVNPFDRVLVRDTDDEEWKPALFWGDDSQREKDYPFLTVSNGHWKQCIPYEGFEHLLGTTDNPNLGTTDKKGGEDE